MISSFAAGCLDSRCKTRGTIQLATCEMELYATLASQVAALRMYTDPSGVKVHRVPLPREECLKHTSFNIHMWMLQMHTRKYEVQFALQQIREWTVYLIAVNKLKSSCQKSQ